MILHTGLRTDIPGFYAPWLVQRLREGVVMARNPYAPRRILRYRLDPRVVDLICFCSKNPGPMLPHLPLLSPFGQLWYVTITPYGRDLEPFVPEKERVLADFQAFSRFLGPRRIIWRYDPIVLTEKYTPEYHLRAFRAMARTLRGSTETCVISFIDLYRKVRRNFPEAREAPLEIRRELCREMVQIARENQMQLRTCHEGVSYAALGAEVSGCMTGELFERALGMPLTLPGGKRSREGCACYLGADVGAYDTCGHLCKYCYANASPAAVARNRRLHDPESPLLVGCPGPEDLISDAKQVSWRSRQIRLDF